MATPSSQQLEKSRLGRLVVNRGYITDAQLQQALEEQRVSGERLGVVLVRAGWITERELERTLKHQKRYRYAAALTAIVVTPLQPMAALASPAPALPNASVQTSGQQLRSASSGIQPLNEGEMGGVVAQGREAFPGNAMDLGQTPATEEDAQDQALEALEFTARTFVPAMNFLDADVTVSGVEFGPEGSGFSVSGDGDVSLPMPERIREIRMERVRVDGAADARSMGNLTMTNIRFAPDSSLTIRTR
ncbi:type II secretion protein ATPase [Halomonadaceae bacterium KBTZ08]